MFSSQFMNQTYLDLLQEGSHIIKASPSEKDFNKMWRSFFGCSPEICVKIWALLKKHSFLPPMPKCRHLMWALLLLKTYAHDSASSALVGGCDLKTWRKYSWDYVSYIANLEPKVVSLLVLHIITHSCFVQNLNLYSIA